MTLFTSWWTTISIFRPNSWQPCRERQEKRRLFLNRTFKNLEEDSLNWFRNKGKDDYTNDPTGGFRKLDSMVPKKGQTPESRARDIEDALDWMRNNVVSPDDDDAIEQFNKIGSISTSSISSHSRAADERP
jgi:hypothetical protein